MSDQELYQKLNLDSNASNSEIKKAYYKLALKYHPDKNPGQEDLFKEITHAYEILSDEQKRKNYDLYGLFNSSDNVGVNLFASFFKDFNFEPEDKTNNVTINLEVTYQDIYLSKTINYNFKRNVICHECKGKKYYDLKLNKNCIPCAGRGKITKINNFSLFGLGMNEQVCDSCSGKGKIIPEDNICKSCKGEGFTVEDKNYKIRLKSLMDMEVKFIGEAHESHDLIPGDLIFEISIKYDKRYDKNKLDLLIKDKVPLVNAISGDTFEITHLNGEKIKINADTIIKPNSVWKIPKLGFKDENEIGDLYFEFDIDYSDFTILEKNFNYLKDIFNQKKDSEYKLDSVKTD